MRWVGTLPRWTGSHIQTEAEKIASETGKVVVLERAKYKTRAGKLRRCTRVWLDLNSDSPKVIRIQEWDANRTKQNLKR